MSKAFTKEDSLETPELPRLRAPLPEGITNYVTPRGIALLRTELSELENARATTDEDHLPALHTRIAEVAARLGSAVTPPELSSDEIRFGATVAVQDEAGVSHTYCIVGIDEANAKEGRLAFIAPLAVALIGRRVGDHVELSTPRGDQVLKVVRITHEAWQQP